MGNITKENDAMKIEEKYGSEIESVWSAIAAYTKGVTVPWKVIEQAMGRAREDRGGWHIIRRVRRRLLRDRQITSLPDVRVGLRLLTDVEAVREIPELRQKKARRQINRGLREMEAIDVAMLSPHESQCLAISRKYMKVERLEITRGRKEAETLMRATQSGFRFR
jgi:hypothetical protein